MSGIEVVCEDGDLRRVIGELVFVESVGKDKCFNFVV